MRWHPKYEGGVRTTLESDNCSILPAQLAAVKRESCHSFVWKMFSHFLPDSKHVVQACSALNSKLLKKQTITVDSWVSYAENGVPLAPYRYHSPSGPLPDETCNVGVILVS
jgi:hypothetical protein